MIRTPLIFSFFAFLAACLVSGFTLLNADPSMLVPVHWNASGEPDSFVPLQQAMLGMPILVIAIVGLFTIIPSVVPNRQGLEASKPVYVWSWIGTLLTILAFHIGTAQAALGKIDAQVIPQIGLVALAVLFVGLGNFVAKSRQNWAVGLRTPWTLSDPDAWVAGNRVMGWGFVLTGLALGVSILLGSTKVATQLFVAGALLSALIGAVVSFITWKRKTGSA